MATKKPHLPQRMSKVKALLKFRNAMDEMHFVPVSSEEKITRMVHKKMVKPKRATVDNVLQNEYKYEVRKFTVAVLTASTNGKFNPKGTAWIHIVNNHGKKVLTREFYKKDLPMLLYMLRAYATVFKNIVDSRGAGMDIVPVVDSETSFMWSTTDGRHTKSLDIGHYLVGLTEDEKEFVLTRENERNYYLKRTKGKVTRQRDLQHKWTERA